MTRTNFGRLEKRKRQFRNEGIMVELKYLFVFKAKFVLFEEYCS